MVICKSILRILSTIVILLTFSNLSAKTVPITSFSDTGMGSLRMNIALADSGDTLQFLTSGTIPFETMIVIDKALTIIGLGPDKVMFNGQKKTRLFLVDSAQAATFTGVAFMDGSTEFDTLDSGAAVLNRGTLRTNNCLFKGNIAKYGGAIHNQGFASNYGPVTIYLDNCSFIENTSTDKWGPSIDPSGGRAQHAGGAIHSNGGSGGLARIFAINTTFSKNTATETAGAIYNVGSPTSIMPPRFDCINCTIVENTSPDIGGIENGKYGRTYIENSILANNTGTLGKKDLFGAIFSRGNNILREVTEDFYFPDAGVSDSFKIDPKLGPLHENVPLPYHSLLCNSPAIDLGNPASASMSDQTGRIRTGAPDAGAIERSDVDNIKVTKTDALGKGSFYYAVINACPGDTIDMTALTGEIYQPEEIILDKDLSIFGNPTYQLYINATGPTRILSILPNVNIEIRDLTFAYGRPDLYGGGAIQNKGILTIEKCTFFDNHARSGGAIANYGDGGDAVLDIINTTFSANSAILTDGGAIDNYSFSHDATVNLTHCTFANNNAVKRGGAIYNHNQGIVQIQNTLVAKNSAPEGPEVYGPVFSKGNNLIGDDADVSMNLESSDIKNTDAKIGDFGFYGGATYTYSLLAGSPAIDAGESISGISWDQRGLPRKINSSSDIGSFEFDATTTSGNLFTNKEISLWPNPSNGHFLVSIPNEMKQSTLQIIDFQGRALHSQELTEGQSQHKIKVSELPRGIYNVVITNGSFLFTKKLIID